MDGLVSYCVFVFLGIYGGFIYRHAKGLETIVRVLFHGERWHRWNWDRTWISWSRLAPARVRRFRLRWCYSSSSQSCLVQVSVVLRGRLHLSDGPYRRSRKTWWTD